MHRMGEAALDAHDHRLVLLVADDDALQRSLRHLTLYFTSAFGGRALRLGGGFRRRGRRVALADALLRGDGLDAGDVAAHLRTREVFSS